MKKLIILLGLFTFNGCLSAATNDSTRIINNYKDVYKLLVGVYDKSFGFERDKHLTKYNSRHIIELSYEKVSRAAPLKKISFFDVETEELLFSYTNTDLLELRQMARFEAKKCSSGEFILTEKGLHYQCK